MKQVCLSVFVAVYKSSKSAFALVGGILTILGSFGCILLSLFFVNGFIYNWGEYPNSPTDYWALFIGMLSLLSFILGVIGGIMALSRKSFALAAVGSSLVAVEAFVVILYLFVRISSVADVLPVFYAWNFTFYYTAFLLVMLGVLGVIFVVVARREFR